MIRRPDTAAAIARDIPDHLLAIQSPATKAAIRSLGRKVRAKARWKTDVTPMVARSPGSVVLLLKGLRLVNLANTREHFREAGRRAHWQRSLIWRRDKETDLVEGVLVGIQPPPAPWLVTVERVGPGHMDPEDGLRISCKHVIDAIAAWLGVDDRDLPWGAAQTRGPGYAVRIEVRHVA